MEYLHDMEFALLRLISGSGQNQDFQQMTPDEQENWLLFIQATQEQIRFYEYWLMMAHLKNDPNGDRLENLPRSVAGKIRATKQFVEKMTANEKAKTTL